jgi:hypothetical protein
MSSKSNDDQDAEGAAISSINQALAGLSDDATKERVLRWAMAKFLNAPQAQGVGAGIRQQPKKHAGPLDEDDDNDSMVGIAELTQSGELRITARDLKATSTNDAAIRLVHIAAYAYEALTGNNQVSSPDIVVPILREWRAYNGNTRTAIKNERGIIREGDKLRLDQHAKESAKEFISEIKNPEQKGTWNPEAQRKRRSRAKKLTVEPV